MSWIWRRRHRQELDEELQSHLRMAEQDAIERGRSSREAREAARRELGNVGLIKEVTREVWGWTSLERLMQDLRFGARLLGRNPGFTLIAVLTLALGIGANTALFSLVNSVLLNPLPFPQPDRLCNLFESTRQFDKASVTYPNFLDWQRDNRSFVSMAAYRFASFTLTDAGETERPKGEMISAGFFSTLGVQPLAGRLFTPEDDRLGAPPVALISEEFWRRKFGASPDLLGQTIVLDGTPHVVVGIIPAKFQLLMWSFRTAEVYTPIGQWDLSFFRNRATAQGMRALGRLKPGVTAEQASADINRIASALAAEYPEADKGIGVSVMPMKKHVVSGVAPTLLLLLVAVGMVLLIACVNVANLLLARSTVRTREFGIRVALGATSTRNIRQLLTESVLLALAGGALGLMVAAFATQAAVDLAGRFLQYGLPRAQEVTIDWRVLGFTAALTILVGVVFGLVPALKTRHFDLQSTLKEGARGATSARSRLQNSLVIAELAMAFVVLVGAGLMIRSLARLWSVNPGFNPDHVVTFDFALAPSMRSSAPYAIRAAFDQASGAMAAVPGVKSVALLSGGLPMQSDSEDPFWIEGRPRPLTNSDMPWALWYEVGPNYLTAMGVPLLQGRFFSASDNAQTPRVAVIDETLAEKYFPRENPIGHRIVDDYVGPAEIIGVIGHVKQWGLDDNSPLHAQMYFSLSQLPDDFVRNHVNGSTIIVRYEGPLSSAVDSLRAAIARMNSEQVIFNVRTMDESIAETMADRRFLRAVLMIFAALALVLSSVGIYGVLAYLVSQRTNEIGIRIALGAQRSDVLSLIFGDAVKLAIAGVGIGLVAALGIMRLMESMLYGVSASDPVTYLSVASLLMFIGLLACYIPARRAMHTDPIVALRYE